MHRDWYVRPKAELLDDKPGCALNRGYSVATSILWTSITVRKLAFLFGRVLRPVRVGLSLARTENEQGLLCRERATRYFGITVSVQEWNW